MKLEISAKIDEICRLIEENIYESSQTGLDDLDEGFEIHNNPYKEGYGFKISGKYIKEVETKINELYETLKVEDTYRCSAKYFKKILIDLMFLDKFDYQGIIEKMRSIKLIESHYIYRIYGITFSKNTIAFGKYTFINQAFLRTYIEKSNAIVQKWDEYYLSFNSKDKEDFAYVDIKYTSSDTHYGNSQTLIELKDLIYVLHYCSGMRMFNTRFVLDTKPNKAYLNDVLIFTDNLRTTSGSKIEIKDKVFELRGDEVQDSKELEKRFWKMISNSNPDEITKRVRTAIIWTGISLREENETIAFTEAMFALESLYKFDDDIMSKSVTAQLSEAVALTLRKTLEERIQLEKDIKSFYRDRSKITHTGMMKTSANYSSFVKIVYDAIKLFLDVKPYSEMKSIKELQDLIIRMKYTPPTEA